MKSIITLLVIAGGCFMAAHSNADDRTAIITWTGNGGYRTEMTLTYDPLDASVFAGGDLGVQGPTNQGIASLDVNFFGPSSLQPLYSVTDVSNSVVLYRFLNISFDTSASSMSGSYIDVGKDTFGEGLPGSSQGEYYLHGLITSPTLVDAYSLLNLDSGGQFNVTVVPEPAICELLGIAGVGIYGFRLRDRSNKSAANAGRCSVFVEKPRVV